MMLGRIFVVEEVGVWVDLIMKEKPTKFGNKSLTTLGPKIFDQLTNREPLSQDMEVNANAMLLEPSYNTEQSPEILYNFL